ncbi:MAG: sigma 54-interacting transcriptional regulator [Candidatus Celaenobacter antarcticus]|nr:sigma 54-interacting transcriptional regulator [Candidatus Celaenobacter antarcticus]
MNKRYIDTMRQEVKGQINECIKLGWSCLRNYKLYTAREEAEKIFNIAKENSYNKGKMVSHYLHGMIDVALNRFDSALEHYFKGLEAVIYTEDRESISISYENIGRCYGQIENYHESITYLKKAFEIQETASVCDNIGECYLLMGKINTAIEFLQKSYTIHKDQGGKKKEELFGYGDTCTNLADAHIKRGEFAQALSILKEVLNLSVLNEDIILQIHLFTKLGLLYSHTGNYVSAEFSFQKAIGIAENIKNNEQIYNCYKDYVVLFEKKGNYKTAYEIQKKCFDKRQEVFNQELQKKVYKIKEYYNLQFINLKKREERLLQEKEEIESKIIQLKDVYDYVSGIGTIGVFSEKMESLVKMALFFHNDRGVPVIIEGETGTGKEILARLVHYGKEDVNQPFVTVNCSAITHSLFESEIFGYESGAFTGASDSGRVGKFEEAQNGTIFLDEIVDLPLSLQPKLLRAIQQREITRVGGNKSISLNVRIIAATNRDLKKEIEKGTFRSDLYYRLNTGYLFIPPLRERKEEIIKLALMFLQRLSTEKRKKFMDISQEVKRQLVRYDWPGNIRELRNAIERIVILFDDHMVKPVHTSFLFGNNQEKANNSHILIDPNQHCDLNKIMVRIISKLLERFSNNTSKTSKYLNTSRNTIYKYKDILS